MSSTALSLVNKVLAITGDYPPNLTAIAGAPGDIGDRVLHFLNLTIDELDTLMNWPQLRVNAQGTADGVTGIMEWGGTEDVRSDGPISVWVSNYTQDPLEEVTPWQFDRAVNSKMYTGAPAIFQRGVATSGKMQVQIYPVPASGDTINVSAYKRATKLVADTDTTEYDDNLLVYGAVSHMDAYVGMERGYTQKFEQAKRQAYAKVYGNSSFRIVPEDYH